MLFREEDRDSKPLAKLIGKGVGRGNAQRTKNRLSVEEVANERD